MLRSFALAVAAASLLCACSDDDGETQPQPSDGGVPPVTGPVDIPWLAAGNPPIQPSPPHTCPEGFTQETTDTGIIACRPWPAGGPASCSGREAHFPGEPGCAPVGTACPAGDFPEGLPSGRDVVYARAGASGGNGSTANPYGSVGEAITAAPTGAVIAVGKGTYDERVELDKDVTVWGACPEETILTQSAAPENDVVVGAVAGNGTIRNLTVQAPVTLGIYADLGNQLRVEDVVIDGAHGWGIYLAGAGTHADIENVIVRDTGTLADGSRGVGIQIIDGATAAVKWASLERSAETQLIVGFGSVVTVDRAAMRDATGTASAPRAGLGLAAYEAGTATVTASGFWGNLTGGALAEADSHLTLTDVAVEETSGGEDTSSPGLDFREGSTIDASFVYIEHARGTAMLGSTDSAMTASDVVVRDTLPLALSLSEGSGLSLESGAQATLSRVLVEKSRRAGIGVKEGSRLHASDIVVRDTLSSGPRELGVGMTLLGVEQVIERAIIERSSLEGIAATGGAIVTLTDVVVRDTLSAPTGGSYGRGLELNLAATVTASRVVLERNREVSLMVVDSGSIFHGTDVVVRDSQAQACGEGCANGSAFGYGVAARNGGQVQLAGFQVTRSYLLGMQVGPGSSILAERGEVSENVIGINVQETAYDAGSALTDVVFRDNVNNYDGAAVPLPDVGIGGP